MLYKPSWVAGPIVLVAYCQTHLMDNRQLFALYQLWIHRLNNFQLFITFAVLERILLLCTNLDLSVSFNGSCFIYFILLTDLICVLLPLLRLLFRVLVLERGSECLIQFGIELLHMYTLHITHIHTQSFNSFDLYMCSVKGWFVLFCFGMNNIETYFLRRILTRF